MFTDQATFAGTGAGTANAQTATLPNVSSYADLLGAVVKYVPGTTNTGDTVLTINSIGSAPHFRKPSSTGLVALTGGELIAGIPVAFVYDGTYLNLLGAALTTPAGQWPNFLSGLGLTYDSATVLDVTAGACADSTNTFFINLGAFTKSTAGAWAAGSGNNGMGVGLTIAVSTWYHAFSAIINGAADVFFDTSISAANKPAGTTAFRRIGSFKTDSSAHIVAFVQDGDFFQWSVPVAEFSNQSTQGTSAVTETLGGVPTGVNVRALLIAGVTNSAAAESMLFSDLATTDEAPTAIATGGAGLAQFNSSGAGTNASGTVTIRTNTAAQIRARWRVGTSATAASLTTTGWYDPRGKTY